ncbi:MAG: VCBS repeat-containing protein, partial [Prevotella sp.]|nr:VCBS repeat-containing protein [Prevotella sp.]
MKQNFLSFLILLFLLISPLAKGQVPTLPEGVVFPDNISASDCFVTPDGFDWAIKQAWVSTQNDIATYLPPIAGDLDGDGLPEIVVGKYGVGGNIYRSFTALYVYKGSNRTTPIVVPIQEGNYMQAGAMALARIPIGADTIPLIVMIDNSGYLRAYNPFKTGGVLNANDYVWISNAQITDSYTTSQFGSVAFVDFNGDGIPEIYVGNRIFNAATGTMLIDGASTIGTKGATPTLAAGVLQYFPAVGDVDGDGLPEYVAGTSVYKVSITNLNGTGGNTFSLFSQMNPINAGGGITVTEGITILADFNKDGRLDAVIVSQDDVEKYTIAIWDIHTKTVLGTITDISSSPSLYYRGIPFIGDVDADGKLEIVLTAVQGTGAGWLNGYRWNGANSLTRVYRTSTSDSSGSTGMTIFDFDQSGKAKLVYRDETDLRIMEAIPGIGGSEGTFNNLVTYPAGSGTYFEHPIIVDVDNDGAAEIVVVGGAARGAQTGTLRIYKSGNEYAWAPARKVWNQYAYNVVNVNEDLTIPRYQMSPATIFPGENGILGDGDDIQPFNNFLQQQTTLSKYGTQLWLAPNGQIAGTPVFDYNETDDKMTVTVQVHNAGEAIFQNPFYVTAYKDNVGGTPKHTYKYENTIAVGGTASISFDIEHFQRDWCPYNFIVLKRNDDGDDGTGNQAVCDDSQSQYRYYGLLPTTQQVCLGNEGAMTCSFALSSGDTYQWQSS